MLYVNVEYVVCITGSTGTSTPNSSDGDVAAIYITQAGAVKFCIPYREDRLITFPISDKGSHVESMCTQHTSRPSR